ncbi:hypothetical protein BJF79_11520 [Actinomadura sp. CNU-125]|uniref:DUF2637 domain-containing protein n=1 Tax=Actinomadura sp. CNU-125 TaxID=1904961 RepID=UPI00096455C4|nr:DUF2637 domain-containing protein [Actinomadura sp. CNU-125]OLT27503.1 hypothetical protein BJF79_11520 [Actinomadura sp. CNU-125]
MPTDPATSATIRSGGPRYTRGQRRLLTALAGLVVAALAAGAFALTYDTLRDLAVAGRVDERWAPIYPAMADALITMTLLSLAITRGARWFTRLLRWALLLLLAAGLAALAVQDAVWGLDPLPDDRVRAGVAIAPHVTLMIAVWLWMTLFKQIRLARPGGDAVEVVETQRGHVKVLPALEGPAEPDEAAGADEAARSAGLDILPGVAPAPGDAGFDMGRGEVERMDVARMDVAHVDVARVPAPAPAPDLAPDELAFDEPEPVFDRAFGPVGPHVDERGRGPVRRSNPRPNPSPNPRSTTARRTTARGRTNRRARTSPHRGPKPNTSTTPRGTTHSRWSRGRRGTKIRTRSPRRPGDMTGRPGTNPRGRTSPRPNPPPNPRSRRAPPRRCSPRTSRWPAPPASAPRRAPARPHDPSRHRRNGAGRSRLRNPRRRPRKTPTPVGPWTRTRTTAGSRTRRRPRTSAAAPLRPPADGRPRPVHGRHRG